jgi:queuosine precursor transporter
MSPLAPKEKVQVMNTRAKTTTLGIAAVLTYIGSIPLANWMINNIGRTYGPDGPHLLPVGFGYEAPSGVIIIGFALVARDIVHRIYGWRKALGAIAVGTVLSLAIAPSVAIASGLAFALGELADLCVYAPLARKRLRLAVIASGIVGAFVDSIVFLTVAFGSTEYLIGNTLGKIWMSVIALPFVGLMRRAVPDTASR